MTSMVYSHYFKCVAPTSNDSDDNSLICNGKQVMPSCTSSDCNNIKDVTNEFTDHKKHAGILYLCYRNLHLRGQAPLKYTQSYN